MAREEQVRVTRCEPGDRSVLHALWSALMPAEPFPASRFWELIDATGLSGARLLRHDDEPVGFVHAAAQRDAVTRTGWVLGFGVHPAHRRRGHGRALLRAALEHLRESGCETAAVGGPGEAYLVPGVDRAAYPAAAGALADAGFHTDGETAGMELDLTATGGGADADRAPAGVDIRQPHAGEHDATAAMIGACFSPGWAALAARVTDGDRLLVAFRDGRPVGFAGYDLFGGCPGRFGPTGVVPDARGDGIGSALLRRTLAAMRARGHERAWFLWGPEGAAGEAMYRSAGFVVNRRFEFCTRPLAPAAGA